MLQDLWILQLAGKEEHYEEKSVNYGKWGYIFILPFL